MWVLKRLFNFYISGSVHVAVAVLSLVLMTNHMFGLAFDFNLAGFVFFGTIVGYNFIKYEYLFRKRKPIRDLVEAIVIFSVIALLASIYFFILLRRNTQLVTAFFFGLTFLYTVPLSSGVKNFRNLSGIKIYIVALCWAGVTILLPLANAGIGISPDVFVKFGQRFLLVIVLILVFEIIDLKKDDPMLMTVPQIIGVKRTKQLGFVLLILFYLLEFLLSTVNVQQLVINLALVSVTAVFTVFATPQRSKYYTGFWVESIPIFWLAMLLVFG
jgi:hypothetical protein